MNEICEVNTKMEIERYFLIENVEAIRWRLMELGFKCVNRELQENLYFDYEDFRLRKDKCAFRIRFSYDLKGQFVKGEVSLSKRRYDSQGNEVRDQQNMFFEDRKVMEFFVQVAYGLNHINSFELSKTREEWSKEGGEDFRKNLHVEIDTDIGMSMYPDHASFVLEDTLQLCVETDSPDNLIEIGQLMKDLGLRKEDISEKNYGDRLVEKLQADGLLEKV